METLFNEQAETPPTSDLLLKLKDRTSRGPVHISDIIEIAGPRAHAAILAIVALPEELPLPIAGMSTLLSSLDPGIGAYGLFGAAKGVPRTVAKRQIPQKLVAVVASRAASILQMQRRDAQLL